jgi:hypothetical protein
LQFALFLGEELLDMLRGLVVHDIELDPEPFPGEFVELLFYASKMVTSLSPAIGMAKMAFAS